MSETVSLTLKAQINGGPSISSSRTVIVEAYDSIKVTISAGDNNKEVEVLPGGTIDVSFLAIVSDRYDAALTYKVNSNADDAPSIHLDQPLILAGKGAVGLLIPPNAPVELFFSSDLDEDAEIHILMGRDAIVPVTE